MSKNCFVGFDTSNYTTSVAICSDDGEIVANIKRPLTVKDGERGLRQSDAVFAHTKNLPEACDELRDKLQELDMRPVGVGVSSRPRSADGSYMPCFLAGVSAAHAFASAADIPILEFSHQDGHVMAALYSSGEMDKLIGRPFVAFHVSGGTTEMLLASAGGDPFALSLIGETADLNAGQVIDRVGVMLGLKFPCGAALEALASEYDGKIPNAKISVRSCEKIECNLSGVENMAKKLYEDTGDKSKVAAFVFDLVCRTLVRMGELAVEKYGELPMLFAGGVMSNKLMRQKISAYFDAYFSEPQFSADNAAGTALLCRRKMIRK